MAERILVVEDEVTLCSNIARALERSGHSVVAVSTGTAALAQIAETTFDIVISDLRLPDLDGLEVLAAVRASNSETVVLIMTAYASVDSAVEALRRGAHDYILKPLTLLDLQHKVQLIAERRRLGQENARLRTLVRGESEPLALLRRGGSAMQQLCELIERFGATSSTVLVLGESGSGKELVARALHEASPRRDAPFVSLNVSAIPDTLVESYLFGHERGAFTGADKRREGLFRAASGGTLFLDEIGELPLPVQAKLLRATETKEVLPVGSDRGIKVDTRIITATHRDLSAMVEQDRFRRDLLYRLSVLTVQVPPLRARPDDIAALALHLAQKHAREQRKGCDGIEAEALRLLERWTWPGNVRELANILERAVLLMEGRTIRAVDLPMELHLRATSTPTPPARPNSATALTTEGPKPFSESQTDGWDLTRAIADFERVHIARALAAAGGNREAAAKLLGLSTATLYRHLQRLGLKGSRGEES